LGDWTQSGLTGSGHAITGNTGPYLDISVTVTNFGARGRKIGNGPLFPVKYIGSIALGWAPDDAWACNPAAANMWEPIHFESQDFNVQPRWGNIYGPSIFWMLQPGVEITLYTSW
jgi:hypothetical protein